MASHRITDVSAKDISACCIFEYHGFEISVSTIFANGDVLVSHSTRGIMQNFWTVEQAIEFINNITKED